MKKKSEKEEVKINWTMGDCEGCHKNDELLVLTCNHKFCVNCLNLIIDSSQLSGGSVDVEESVTRDVYCLFEQCETKMSAFEVLTVLEKYRDNQKEIAEKEESEKEEESEWIERLF